MTQVSRTSQSSPKSIARQQQQRAARARLGRSGVDGSTSSPRRDWLEERIGRRDSPVRVYQSSARCLTVCPFGVTGLTTPRAVVRSMRRWRVSAGGRERRTAAAQLGRRTVRAGRVYARRSRRDLGRRVAPTWWCELGGANQERARNFRAAPVYVDTSISNNCSQVGKFSQVY